MVDQSSSARCHALFEPALQTYEKTTGIKLGEHPLALQLQSCHSIDDISTLLKNQAQAVNNSQASDRTMKSIRQTLSILNPFLEATSLVDDVGPMTLFPPAKAIQAGFAILLDVANGVISDHDALVELFESIEQFVNRLEIYTRIPLTPPLVELVAKIIVELLSILALATKELKERRSIKFVKKLLREKDVEAVLQRLDRLTKDVARTTAVQTLGVIYGLVQNMSTVMDDGEASIDGVRTNLEIVHQMASDMNKSRRDQLLRDIRRWLSPPDPWKNYNVARGLRHSETGAWFVNGNTLPEWKASRPISLLYIHGKLSAGKSVLCCTIIEQIEAMCKSGLASLAMFFYDFREDQKKDLRGLVSSVLIQLCNQSDSYYNILSTFYSTHQEGAQSPSDGELVQCFKGLLNVQGQAPVYLIIDALDECPSASALSSPRDEVLKLLEELIDSQLPNLWICVTSRPEADIKPVLEPLSFRSISLHDERGQQEDIENYIKSVVNTNKRMRRWTPEYKQLVIDVLTERADGMFRWAYCQLDYLGKCLPGRIRHALDECPETLDATYERTLQEIDDLNWEFAQRLFLCVAVVSRPLRVKELADFLVFDFKAGSLPKYREDWRLEDPVEAVLSTCSTLLALVNVEDSQVIQFSHFSVKEFLTSSRFAGKHSTLSHRYHISMTLAHTLVAQACLGILLHLDENITRDSLDEFPLTKYAAEHWYEHARFEGALQNEVERMKELFDERKPHFAIWLWIWDPTLSPWEQNTGSGRPLPPSGTPLHYAAFCGLYGIIKVLATENSQGVNSRRFRDKSTPLHLASKEGHVEVARFLVEQGADPTTQAKNGRTPLHWASSGGRMELAQFLVEQGADVTARDTDGRTPLHQASYGGHVDLARFLVERGADATAQDEDGWTPLHWASSWGHMELARFLVEQGADATAQAEDGQTPLHVASEWGHLELVRFLVEESADATAPAKDLRKLLHCASSRGHLQLARFLVEERADATPHQRRAKIAASSSVRTTSDGVRTIPGGEKCRHDSPGQGRANTPASGVRTTSDGVRAVPGGERRRHDIPGQGRTGASAPAVRMTSDVVDAVPGGGRCGHDIPGQGRVGTSAPMMGRTSFQMAYNEGDRELGWFLATQSADEDEDW